MTHLTILTNKSIDYKKILANWRGFFYHLSWHFLEHLADALYAFYQGVDFFCSVVEGERSSYGALYAEAYHKRLRAVMTCSDGNAEAVEQCAHI